MGMNGKNPERIYILLYYIIIIIIYILSGKIRRINRNIQAESKIKSGKKSKEGESVKTKDHHKAYMMLIWMLILWTDPLCGSI